MVVCVAIDVHIFSGPAPHQDDSGRHGQHADELTFPRSEKSQVFPFKEMVALAMAAARKHGFPTSAISQARALVPNLATCPLDRAEKLNAFKA